jgi:nitroimidazol reductase NimA-like FMN-containing flavoprotein (pyridoxamine 5'-phosphate oxidase superfamily)
LSHSGQASSLTGEEIELMLKENHTARICTHNKDGTIHAIPVGYSYINGQIIVLSLAKSRKTGNIKRNNDVTVLIDTVKPLRGILIYGKAEIDYDKVYEQATTVVETMGVPKEKVQRFTKDYLDAFKSVVVRITPRQIVSFDYDEVWKNFLKTHL